MYWKNREIWEVLSVVSESGAFRGTTIEEAGDDFCACYRGDMGLTSRTPFSDKARAGRFLQGMRSGDHRESDGNGLAQITPP